MEYKIRFVKGDPRFDTLGVMKLGCDRSVDINSRIYGQAQIGVSDEFFFTRIWSFETAPTAESLVGLNLEADGKSLSMMTSFDESCSLVINGEQKSELLTAYLISGEDLQGEYWGAVMMLPISEFFAALDISSDSLPASLSGNAYRRSETASSFVPMDRLADFILLPNN